MKLQIRIILVYFLFCLSFVPGISASPVGKGTLEGIVIDKKTKEPLIGATVFIRGTEHTTATDIDGKYIFKNIGIGIYTIEIRYISYKTIEIENVKIERDKIYTLDLEMEDVSLDLKGVVVMTQRRWNTDLSVLNTVKSSLPVMSGISSQQISKTQDNDASEVLKRIPGITVVNNRFVVVRGLAQRYNGVWLNKASTPSSESDSRAFSFDVLPSSLIDNIMVYKSISPELPADFTGGFIQVSTKNTPIENEITLQYNTAFTVGTTFKNMRLSDGYAADYIGFGAGKRQLSSIPNLKQGSIDEAVEFTKKLNNRWGVRSFTAIPDQKLSFTLQRKFDFGNWKMGNISAVNYSTGYNHYKMQNNRYQSYRDGQSQYDNKYLDEVFRNTTKLGALFNWSFLFGNTKLEFRNFFNQRGSNSLTQREGHDYYSDIAVRYWESLYTGRTTYTSQLSGIHTLKENVNKIDWTVGYAYAGYNEPDRRVVNSKLDESRTENKYYVDDVKRYYQKLHDNSFSASTAYEHKLNVNSNFTPVLKAGIYSEYKDRSFDAQQYQYNLLGSGYSRYTDWEYGTLFSDSNIAADKIYLSDKTEKCDSYTSNNLLSAAYVSATLNYSDKLTANAGVRAEYYHLTLSGYSADGLKPVNIDQNKTDFFPSLNIAYNLNDKNVFRVAYGRSINRPEFREIVPYVYYNFDVFANISGNTDLKDAYIHNVDLRYEFYPAPGETFSVGVFYKKFRNPIEQTYYEAGSGVQYTYHNADRAVCYGAELDIKKNLSFMGLPDLNFVFNGAWIYSKIFFEKGAYERDRPMQGQSPFLINTGLFYQHDKSGWSASLLYNVIGKRIETVGIAKENPNDDIPDVYELPRNLLDLTLSKKIGKRVEIKGGISDILNSKVVFKQFLHLNEGNSKRVVEQLVKSYRPGMQINLGISVKI
ncbi:TonB-dependent receptor [Coprobacter tertius]|uniref:TonB-dependent receptor n=1 Tax=Coprobacter tertius TaxID=2944915 RepID=A0ABT1MGQ3_9BACT|nr:TonB-dependent receptor [Coprobacter tertius]MCP9611824.1 TonB-dependent receptor [Coprobacter tertius]